MALNVLVFWQNFGYICSKLFSSLVYVLSQSKPAGIRHDYLAFSVIELFDVKCQRDIHPPDPLAKLL